MVSFSCEACGDVLTKKKLDAHRGRCRHASFTCLDCMTHFTGMDYRNHTSCVTEAQKYEGAMHRAPVIKRKAVTIAEPATRQSDSRKVPHARVDDASGSSSDGNAPAARAPSQSQEYSQATMDRSINVFDYLDEDDQPVTSQGPGEDGDLDHKPMRMVAHAPFLFKSATASPQAETLDSQEATYQQQGYAYGTKPIAAATGDESYRTPAAAAARVLSYETPADRSSTDKKRKRHVEELDLRHAPRLSQEADEPMELDGRDLAAVTPGLHTGLTGGLNKLLSTTNLPPSPDSSDSSEPETGVGVAKRTKALASITKSDKPRGRLLGGQLVKLRKSRRSSDESRPRKHHRSHHLGEEGSSALTHPSSSHAIASELEGSTLRAPARAGLASNQPPAQASHHHQHRRRHRDRGDAAAPASQPNQMVLFQKRADMFLSFVAKGVESTSGCSVDKALKRYHRERGEHGPVKYEEEKALWKALRLKRNDRGEVVLIVAEPAL